MSKKLIESEEIIEKARKSEKDFTRNRKITPKDLIYYNLNRKGLDLCQVFRHIFMDKLLIRI